MPEYDAHIESIIEKFERNLGRELTEREWETATATLGQAIKEGLTDIQHGIGADRG